MEQLAHGRFSLFQPVPACSNLFPITHNIFHKEHGTWLEQAGTAMRKLFHWPNLIHRFHYCVEQLVHALRDLFQPVPTYFL